MASSQRLVQRTPQERLKLAYDNLTASDTLNYPYWGLREMVKLIKLALKVLMQQAERRPCNINQSNFVTISVSILITAIKFSAEATPGPGLDYCNEQLEDLAKLIHHRDFPSHFLPEYRVFLFERQLTKRLHEQFELNFEESERKRYPTQPTCRDLLESIVSYRQNISVDGLNAEYMLNQCGASYTMRVVGILLLINKKTTSNLLRGYGVSLDSVSLHSLLVCFLKALKPIMPFIGGMSEYTRLKETIARLDRPREKLLKGRKYEQLALKLTVAARPCVCIAQESYIEGDELKILP